LYILDLFRQGNRDGVWRRGCNVTTHVMMKLQDNIILTFCVQRTSQPQPGSLLSRSRLQSPQLTEPPARQRHWTEEKALWCIGASGLVKNPQRRHNHLKLVDSACARVLKRPNSIRKSFARNLALGDESGISRGQLRNLVGVWRNHGIGQPWTTNTQPRKADLNQLGSVRGS